MKLTEGKTRQIRQTLESNLGRPIKDSEVIHHINGNPFDNRIENLRVMDRTEHGQYHAKLEKNNTTLYGRDLFLRSTKHRPPLRKRSGAINMKKLHQWASEWLRSELRASEDISSTEIKRAVLLAYFDFVWKHRND